MTERQVLLVGGTGLLGGRVAVALADAGAPFRALVRPGRDVAALSALGAEPCRGDLRDPTSLSAACAGVHTVITTANAIGRLIKGDRQVGSIESVDHSGNAALIGAAEAAGCTRFVFVSLPEALQRSGAPFAEAKEATERLLRESPLRSVIVRSDAFQELWFSKDVGFDWRAGRAIVLGRGRTRQRFVAVDDVGRAVVALALAPDPPAVVEPGGPDALCLYDAMAIFAAVSGRRMRAIRVPRPVLRLASATLGRVDPVRGSLLRMSLAADTADSVCRVEDLTSLGIEPRSVQTYARLLCDAADD
jgi:NADH dehydrogenase